MPEEKEDDDSLTPESMMKSMDDFGKVAEMMGGWKRQIIRQGFSDEHAQAMVVSMMAKSMNDDSEAKAMERLRLAQKMSRPSVLDTLFGGGDRER